LREAILIEGQSRNAYLCFSRLFSRRPDVSKFWKELSRDEDQHIKILTALSRSLTPEQMDFPADPDLARKVAETRMFLKRNPVGGIKTLDEAYEFAHALEDTEVVPLFRLIARKYISDREEVKSVLDEIQEHQRKLLEFGDRFGGPDWRESVRAGKTA